MPIGSRRGQDDNEQQRLVRELFLEQRTAALNNWFKVIALLASFVLLFGLLLEIAIFMDVRPAVDRAKDAAEAATNAAKAAREATETAEEAAELVEEAQKIKLVGKSDSRDSSDSPEWSVGLETYSLFLDTVRHRELLSEDGTLATTAFLEFKVELEDGERATFFAACDNACTNLDLVLSRAEDDTILSVDREKDAVPVIQFKASGDEDLKVRLDMVSCDGSSGCEWKLRGYAHKEP